MKWFTESFLPPAQGSPSLRRVWVEMAHAGGTLHPHYQSPSLRRVWVEIVREDAGINADRVTLLAEGVG